MSIEHRSSHWSLGMFSSPLKDIVYRVWDREGGCQRDSREASIQRIRNHVEARQGGPRNAWAAAAQVQTTRPTMDRPSSFANVQLALSLPLKREGGDGGTTHETVLESSAGGGLCCSFPAP